MPTTIDLRTDGAVGHLTLDRPEKLNPLGAATLQELVDAAGWFDDRPEVRVVVISGRGRAFSAGADVAAFGGKAANEGLTPREAADLGRLAVEAVERMQAVTVAAVHGHCIGGAVLLALACDLRVAADDAGFAIPEIELGIPLAWGGIPRLVREVGPAVARDLVLTARRVEAAEALQLGLVNRVVPAADLAAEVEALAGLLAQRSPLTLRTTLRQVDAAAESLVTTAGTDADADLLVEALADPESREVARHYLSRLSGH